MLELEVPSAVDPSELVVSAVVPLNPDAGGPALPGFLVEGISADVHALSRDARGRPRTALVSVPVVLRDRVPKSFARLRLESTGEEYQPGEVRGVSEFDLEVVLQTTDGIFRARPFADAERGERQLGRWRSTWKSSAILEKPGGRETRGIVIASLEVRSDGLAVLELLVANGIQGYIQSSSRGGDFCYQELEIRTRSAIVLPMPRAGEAVVNDGPTSVARLVGDGRAHLWPRMAGVLRRFVLAPPGASPAVLERAREVGRFVGTAFAIEGPNSWGEARAHGPELGLLAPWTDSLDAWGPKGQAGARALLEGKIGELDGQRRSGLAGGYFTTKRLGLFHPLGQPQEGEPGGWKIRPVGTFALDRRLLVQRWIELEHGLDRSRVFHFEPRTARPTVAHLWAEKFGGRVPFAWKNHGDSLFPWMRFARQSWGGIIVGSNVTQGRMVEHGDGALLAFAEQDDQHEIRDVEPPETVARFTGSAIALAILEVLAANGELARHEFQSPAGDATIAKLLSASSASPRVGTVNAGRGLAWDLRTIVAFWEFAPDVWRAKRKSWAQAVARWAIQTRGPSGLLGNDVAGGHTSRVAIEAGAPAGFRYVQTFEVAYLEQSLEKLAALAMPGTVGARDLSAVLAGLVEAVDSLWSVRGSTGLVPRFVAVGVDGGPELENLDPVRASKNSEATWIWGLLAGSARVALLQGLGPVEYRLRLARVLVAGRPAGSPAATFEAYVRAAQALEREPWNGSVDYSALAWGEAWRAQHGSEPPPSVARGEEART